MCIGRGDSKLKRDIALKVLPQEFCRDADRVARFQREAEVLASLNHPHIAAIYDLAEFGDSRFLVFELVEGETLAARGPLPVDDSLVVARQIAEAMEAAHEKAVLHRDLKPANIKVTPGGQVKVLDFGLAKILEEKFAKANLSESPTTMSGTIGGTILGTAAYMSPEQARGEKADRTSDVWAFGCVLYEMLTGQQAFGGTFSQVSWGTRKANDAAPKRAEVLCWGTSGTRTSLSIMWWSRQSRTRRPPGAGESEAGAQDHAVDKIQLENVAMRARDHGSTGKIINAHEPGSTIRWRSPFTRQLP